MNEYKIKEAAALIGVPAGTIRFYDKEGLLPNLTRSRGDYRVFTESDIGMLRVIGWLKKSGMSIKEIRQFAKWIRMGDASLRERHEMFLARRQAVEAQIAELQKTLEFVNYKVDYYEKALAAGTEKIHMRDLAGANAAAASACAEAAENLPVPKKSPPAFPFPRNA